MQERYDDKLQDYIVHASDLIRPTVVQTLPEYKLLVTFDNGERKVFDMGPLLDGAIFAPLKEKALFNKAHIAFNTVVWTEDIDIAPESLYEKGVPFTGDAHEA